MTGLLEARLLAAHEADDRAALIALYTQAAERDAVPGGRAFYLTHAYVYALETGDARAAPLHAALVALGAEA